MKYHLQHPTQSAACGTNSSAITLGLEAWRKKSDNLRCKRCAKVQEALEAGRPVYSGYEDPDNQDPWRARRGQGGSTVSAAITTKRTPLQVWPPRKFRGSPGYSAGHYAMLAGAPEDPLRVAERIQARVDSAEVALFYGERIKLGADPSEMMDKQTSELNRRSQERWARLCADFNEVIAVLESAPQTPAMKQLVKLAKREAKRSP